MILTYDEPEYDAVLLYLDGRQPHPFMEDSILSRFTPDGEFVVYTRPRAESFGFDIRRRSLTGDGSDDEELVARSTIDWYPEISPDGRFMLYTGDESGRFEVYLTTFPDPGSRWQVSRDGGEFPRWSKNGREIVFTTRDQIWAVDVDTSSGVTLGRPKVLFDRPNVNWSPQWADGFDVTADGGSFIFVRPKADDDSARPAIVVTQNWFREFSGD
jgi:Tol biopolymer transport system component